MGSCQDSNGIVSWMALKSKHHKVIGLRSRIVSWERNSVSKAVHLKFFLSQEVVGLAKRTRQSLCICFNDSCIGCTCIVFDRQLPNTTYVMEAVYTQFFRVHKPTVTFLN